MSKSYCESASALMCCRCWQQHLSQRLLTRGAVDPAQQGTQALGDLFNIERCVLILICRGHSNMQDIEYTERMRSDHTSIRDTESTEGDRGLVLIRA